MDNPILKKSPVTFESGQHIYRLGDKVLKGITGTLVRRAYPDTYKKPDNYTEEEWADILAKAAAKGSNMHETIELHDDLGIESDLPELQSYIAIKKEHGLSVLASEYVVSDEEHYATAIDKVMMRNNGDIVLVDFKRTWDIHFDNVTLQQSICKRWFEKLNPDLKVSAIYVLWMRDDKSKFVELQPWADEQLDALIDADLNDRQFDIKGLYGELPMKVYDVQRYMRRLDEEVRVKSEELKKLKDGLCDLMIKKGIKSFSTPVMKLTAVLPAAKESFDAKAFKADNPELYKQYVRKSEVKPSIRITFQDED